MTATMQKGTPYIEQEEKPRIFNFKGKIRSERKGTWNLGLVLYTRRGKVCTRVNEPLQSRGSVSKRTVVLKDTKYLRHTKPKQMKVICFQT